MALIKIIKYSDIGIMLDDNEFHETVKDDISNISNSTKLIIQQRMKGQYEDLIVITTEYGHYDFISNLELFSRINSYRNETTQWYYLFKNILSDIVNQMDIDAKSLVILDIPYLFTQNPSFIEELKSNFFILADTIESSGFENMFGELGLPNDKYIFVYRNSLTNSRRTN